MIAKKVTNSQRVTTVKNLLTIPVSLHVSKDGTPYRLKASVVRDGDMYKLDIRLFYRRRWKNRVYWTATDKGIRFTKDDILRLIGTTEWVASGELLSTFLLDIYALNDIQTRLDDGHILVIRRDREGDVRFVDVRKYYIHNQTGELVPTGRGFRLSMKDIVSMYEVERVKGADRGMNEYSILDEALEVIALQEQSTTI